MMSQIEVKELVQHLPDVIAAIANGEEVILTDAEAPIARLVKIENEPRDRVPGSAIGLVEISPDFDEPIDHLFEVYEDTD